jgi:hypothetical protein
VDAAGVRRHAADHGQSAIGDRLAALLEACDRERFGAPAHDPPAIAELAAAADRDLRALDRARAAPLSRGATRRVVVLLLCGAAAVLAPGPLRAQTATSAPDPPQLMAEGNRAYTDGDMDRALALYLQARDAGGDAAELHYNLGNTHARRGELGEAVASYLRALRRDPRDRDARANLAWVRGHIRDLELTGTKLPPVVAQVHAALRALTLDGWSLVVLLLVWVLCALVAWGWWRGAIGDGLRRVLLANVAVLVIAGGAAGWRYYDERVRNVGVVTAPEVPVRSGPADSFPVVFEVHDGLTVVLRGAREGWQRISLGGDWVGWVPRDAVTAVRRGG